MHEHDTPAPSNDPIVVGDALGHLRDAADRAIPWPGAPLDEARVAAARAAIRHAAAVIGVRVVEG